MTISDRIRVYELSRDLKLENKDILDAAQKLSISVKSHSSSISLEDAKKIKNLINNKNSSKKILSVSKSVIKAKNGTFLILAEMPPHITNLMPCARTNCGFCFLFYQINNDSLFRFSYFCET